MGATNQPTNLLDRIDAVEGRVSEIWKKIGLAAATIAGGGLTLIQSAFLKMVDSSGVQILYIGPDSLGRQIVALRRDGGATVLYTYFVGPGQQYWTLTDRTENQIFADDAVSAVGIARPHLTMPTRIARWDQLPGSDQPTFETVVETAYFDKQQPKATVQIQTCSSVSGTSGEARLMLDGVQIGATISVGFTVSFTNIGPFDVPGTFMSQHRLELQCRRTVGTGKVGASMIVKGDQS